MREEKIFTLVFEKTAKNTKGRTRRGLIIIKKRGGTKGSKDYKGLDIFYINIKQREKSTRGKNY